MLENLLENFLEIWFENKCEFFIISKFFLIFPRFFVDIVFQKMFPETFIRFTFNKHFCLKYILDFFFVNFHKYFQNKAQNQGMPHDHQRMPESVVPLAEQATSQKTSNSPAKPSNRQRYFRVPFKLGLPFYQNSIVLFL